MRQLSRRVIFAFLALFLISGSPFSAHPAQRPRTLTVSAAISLKDALDQIQRDYTAANPAVRIAINYGASGTLQLQIEQGAPVDVYISASPKQMDALDTKGLLLEGTRKNLLRNEIVLIVPKDSSSQVSSFQDLTRPDVKQIAFGEPTTVPAGEYAKEVLTYLGIYDAVKRKSVLAKDVRQVLTYVATGNVDAGIVYATDALTSLKVRVVATAPESSHAPAIYPIGVTKNSKSPAAARTFEEYLSGSQARAIFQKYGFGPAN